MTEAAAAAAFADGLAHHQAGRIDAARASYEAALLADPAHFDALHMLAVAAGQTGDWVAAAALFERSITINPNIASAHSNHAAALHALGRNDDAIASCVRAIALEPWLGAAHVNRGNALLALARPGEALASYDAALAAGTGDAETHYNRANALRDLGRPDEALGGYAAALALRPGYLEALGNRAALLVGLGRLGEAVACYDAALAAAPGSAEALVNRSSVLQRLQRLEAALADADAAIALRPDFDRAHDIRSSTLNFLHRPDEALAAADRALALNPDLADAHSNRGVTLYDLRRSREALDAYDRALAARPDFPEARMNRSLALLKLGDLQRGFAEYRSRWDMPGADDLSNRLGFPAWEGEDLAGRSIVVFCEQGLGDTLHFVRYVPRLAAMGAAVTLLTEAPLERLLQQIGGVAVTSWLAPGVSFDFQVALLCLPRLFGTTLQTIPGETPYLAADPARAAAWAERLAGDASPRVGLVWAGAARSHDVIASAIDRRRSVRLAQLAPLAAASDATFYSLQVGPPAAEAVAAALSIVDHAAELTDFTETAALVANLDLVITVDTSVAHLAGALGKPVWILSRFDGCWRWLDGRDDSPWYPTSRLFHQRTPGDWDEVVGRVADALGEFAGRVAGGFYE